VPAQCFNSLFEMRYIQSVASAYTSRAHVSILCLRCDVTRCVRRRPTTAVLFQFSV